MQLCPVNCVRWNPTPSSVRPIHTTGEDLPKVASTIRAPTIGGCCPRHCLLEHPLVNSPPDTIPDPRNMSALQLNDLYLGV